MSRRAIAMPEMLAGLILTGLIATLATGAWSAARQRHAVDAASARLEEAQNILARWRSGGAASAEGWSSSVSADATVETIELRGHGLRLSTLRPLRRTP